MDCSPGKFMKKKQAVMLTEGWHVERTTMKDGRERRVFVDPTGQQFEREADVRDVIEMKQAAKRKMEEMQKRRNDADQEDQKSIKEVPLSKKRLRSKTPFYKLCVDSARHESRQAQSQDSITAAFFCSPGKRRRTLGLGTPDHR